jgi:sulfoquinovose isomerase
MTDRLVRPTLRLWLAQHTLDLLAFGRRTPHPDGGARWLDNEGAPRADTPTYTWITGRMVHVYSIGSLLGVPGAAPVAEQALAGLTGRLRDRTDGGWYHAVGDDGAPEPGKACYDHAFVLLAAASASQAGLPGTEGLLADAQRTFLDRFWDEEAGLCVDTWDTNFTTREPYRGLNANMHSVEAMLSIASVTGDRAWVDRAVRVCRFVAESARAHSWRLPEHYDQAWTPLLDYHRDHPDDQFKPFGATIGHGLEWSRLFLHTEAALGPDEAGWLADAAAGLFDRAVTDGWHADGRPGFVYTTDWDGTPVVRARLHWVVAEAINAAAAFHQRTGDERYAALYRQYLDHADQYFIDHEHGSWRPQLAPDLTPDDTVWSGKPDIYHVFQATLIPRLPLYPMLATAVAQGHLA